MSNRSSLDTKLGWQLLVWAMLWLLISTKAKGNQELISVLESTLCIAESIYHLFFDKLFYIHFSYNIIAATGTLRSNRDAKAPLTSVAEMAKQARGSVDFATVENSNALNPPTYHPKLNNPFCFNFII